MGKNNDILKDLDLFEEYENELNLKIQDLEENKDNIIYKYEIIVDTKNINKEKKSFDIFKTLIFIIKYLATTSAIFWVLLVTTNYSAYVQVAKSIIFKEQAEQTRNGILNSVEASKIKTQITEEKKENKDEVVEASTIEKYKKDLDEKDINIDIEITPFSNRIIVPKIWKNIPLLEVKNRTISWESELNDIFMKELENWIIRYPGSAKPGNEWNSFIFGHSSNLPWMKWDYNDVFAKLDNLVFGDEVIAYYWQEKYTYKIREKKVIKPGDVSILKQDPNKTKITLMTCRPIWTTINRLVVIWELVEKD